MRISNRRSAFVALGAVFGLALFPICGASAAGVTVGLGTASSYAVLAGTTVTNTGPSTVAGDLGLSPGTAVTGFPPGVVSGGAIHAADAAAGSAQADLTSAFNDAAGRASTGAITADLAGQTLVPGVYTGGALALNGTLTLDGQGDAGAVFVFQAASSLITGSASRVTLVNGAAACNVFWQVTSSATIGTSSVFVGTVLALTSISAQTNASIDGRLLARNGQVSLDSNTFTRPSCSATTGGTGGATTTTGTGVTGVTIPGTGGHYAAKMKAAVLAVLVGGAMVATTRRNNRGSRVTVVTATTRHEK